MTIQSMQHLYHPFKQKSLSFFIPIDSSKKDSSFNILDDVELYQQPVEDPNVAIAFFITRVATDLKEIDTDIPINRCNGVDHKAFLIQSWSSLGLIKTNFQSLQNDGQNDNFSKVFAVLRRLSKVAQRIWMIFLASNIGEGIIYHKLIKHMTRYDYTYIYRER